MTLPGDPSPTSAPEPAGGPTAYDGGAKKDLRRRLRAARAARSAEDRERVASGLAVRVGTVNEVAEMVADGGGVLAAYASLGDEPGTGPLRSLLALSGVRVLLPVIRDDGGLDWGWDSDDLVPRVHRLAIPEPAADHVLGAGAAGLAASGCSVVLLPALAVGLAGETLIVNLPGSKGGVKDGMAVLSELLVHAVEQIRGGDHPRTDDGAT